LLRRWLRIRGHLKIADASGRRLGRYYKVKLWPTLVMLDGGREVARVVRPVEAGEIGKALERIEHEVLRRCRSRGQAARSLGLPRGVHAIRNRLEHLHNAPEVLIGKLDRFVFTFFGKRVNYILHDSRL
jgi:hypothetical protein